ncbi:hypothetical protein [Micromonospora sp. NBC_01813]|uniref:hypothetical protein n=1 Tax=Micromonospora sp. NBC_01813 TaxID=2975988 RepID=UPI002DD992A0|nr:hypothetical protein [Micromonospora sp. NBC_01813]WSA07735.1 hypothetical protein OG958_26450 [Micromonospora sp. NBC_01813]
MGEAAVGRPGTLDEIAAALDSANCAEVERGAGLLDDARRSLRNIAAAAERTLSNLEDCWRGEGAGIAWPGGDVTASRLAEPLRRTRELVHALDEGEYGQQLRRTANALAAGQARVRELRAQRAADPSLAGAYDERAQLVLHDVAGAYQDIGRALGGTDPPALASVAEPSIGADLSRHARDEGDPMVLASGADVDVELFRPVTPALAAGLASDPLPPAAGGGGGAGGMPMMPMMPMGGMGGMGMGGMGMGGGQQDTTGQQRRANNAIQGDQSAWGTQDEGWNVLGKQARIEKAQEEVRDGLDREFRKFMKGDRNG